MGESYRGAGVDIDEAKRAVDLIARAAATIVAVAPTLEARSQVSPSVRAMGVSSTQFN